jgi:hypothetical protein
MKLIRRNLTYANVVATICLFLLLATGGAWAASKFIPGSKIKPHSITAKQVKKGSLTAGLFKGRLPAGPTGPTGVASTAVGPSGLTGATGVTGPGTIDGPSAQLGRIVVGPATPCLVGAPSGLSTSAVGCDIPPRVSVSSLSVPGRVIRNFRIQLDSPVAVNSAAQIIITNGVYIGCVIPANETGCSEAGPSDPMELGVMSIEVSPLSGSPVYPPASFSYEIAAAPPGP